MANSKNNAALKNDFLSDVLSDELLETLEDESSQDDVLLFESLLDEVEEEKAAAIAPPEEVTVIQQAAPVVEMKQESPKSEPVETEVKAKEQQEVVESQPQPSSEKAPSQEEKRVYLDETAVVNNLEEVANLAAAPVVGHSAVQEAFKRNPAIDLKNADYIQFAQKKIKRLEGELSGVRSECEELAMAGDHFKLLSEEREQRIKALDAKLDEVQSISLEEKKILNEALRSKEIKISALQERLESLEQELESKYNRVRVRERELESRLEILKQEQEAVSYSKDQMILKLRKQNSSLDSDLEKTRAHNQKTLSNLQDKEDALRRTVKALKLSLTMLESQND